MSTRLINKLFLTLALLTIPLISNGQKYRRIVSLAPSLTMNIYYLEAQDRLVGCTSFCEVAKDDNIPVVSNAVKPGIESIMSLDPDLVILTPIMGQETIDLLNKFDVRVEVYESPESFEGICDQFLEIARLLEKEVLADSIVRDARSEVQELRGRLQWQQKPGVFMQLGARPLFTVLTNTFMDDFIQLINGKNIFSELKRGTIAREAVIARNPDIIFIVTMGIIAEEEKEKWESIETLSAAKTDNIFIIDSNLACTPTPISFIETLRTIVGLLSQPSK